MGGFSFARCLFEISLRSWTSVKADKLVARVVSNNTSICWVKTKIASSIEQSSIFADFQRHFMSFFFEKLVRLFNQSSLGGFSNKISRVFGWPYLVGFWEIHKQNIWQILPGKVAKLFCNIGNILGEILTSYFMFELWHELDCTYKTWMIS